MDTHDREKIFTEIIHAHKWGGRESLCGRGSDRRQARIIIQALHETVKELGVKKLLDIPCGDLSWVRYVDLVDIKYIGADITEFLVQKNASVFGSENKCFYRLDICDDILPEADLILCRDCLVHLSFEDVHKALVNIKNSNSLYLLTTTFTDITNNLDINTGEWRPLNLQRDPFCFPKPMKLINEGCTEAHGRYSDKSIGLWKIHDLKIGT